MDRAYAPSSDFSAKIKRRITPLQRRRDIRFSLEKPVVSFTFDDCPLSAVTHGLKPMEREGWRGTVYIASSLFGITNHHGLHMNADDVKAASRSGHEIGGHSFSHIDGNLTNLTSFLKDVTRNQATLNSLDIPPCRTFAYPFGEVTPGIKTALEKDFFGLRGIAPKPMVGRADLNQICSTPVYHGLDFDRAIAQINDLAARPAWVTLFMHDICNTPSDWGCTPAHMQSIIEAVKAVDATVLPVADAIEMLGGKSNDKK